MNHILRQDQGPLPKWRVRLAVIDGAAATTGRPTKRADCLQGGFNAARPCPFVGCRHHTFIDVPANKPRELVFNYPGREPWEIAQSCTLDIADDGPHELNDAAVALGVTKQAISHTEQRALRKAAGAITEMEHTGRLRKHCRAVPASRWVPVMRPCARCGGEFKALIPRQIYCKRSCQVKAPRRDE